MTLTFNPDRYKELLDRHQQQLIKTEAENDEALAVVEELMHKKPRTPKEEELYQLLIILIEKFEQDYYSPGSYNSANSVLLFLMEQQGIKPEDLVAIIGSPSEVSEIVNGRREISKTQAKALAEIFHVDPSLFI